MSIEPQILAPREEMLEKTTLVNPNTLTKLLLRF